MPAVSSEEKFIEDVFSQKGMLSRILKDYEERIEQKEMAHEIALSYRENAIALIEAGTGTGKSFAYLVPALYWALKTKEKTVISTHTIALQEQLLEKDIPFLLKALELDVAACLVKGMRNYVCLRKLKEVQEEPLLIAPGESYIYRALEAWADKTQDGSKSDVSFPLGAEVWDKISADAESCNRTQCPHYKKCFFFKARKKAEEAQILVVNHALLFADIQLKKQEKEGILPSYQRLVLDEAHHIEQVALESSAQRFDRLTLMLSLVKIYTDTHPDKTRIHLLRSDLLSSSALNAQRMRALDSELPGQVRLATQLLDKMFFELRTFLEHCSGKMDLSGYKMRLKKTHLQDVFFKERILPSCLTLAKQLEALHNAMSILCKDLEALKETAKIQNHLLELLSFCTRLAQGSEFLVQFVADKNDDAKRVFWIEVFRDNISLYAASLDVSTFCSEYLFTPLRSAILCSATLATLRAFTYTKQRLGLKDEGVRECVYDSPFDFATRSLFLVPTDLPLAHEPSYLAQLIFTIEQAVETCKGGAFVLFTSYDMLTQCYRSLSAGALARHYSLFKQGDLPRHALLEQFKKREGSVLFATDSFWEGVDVPGDALRCVIIAKLPFPVPSEPLHEAQAEMLEKEGKDPFSEYAVPQAVIKFKQGFGRLLRTKKDRGCILCLDVRLVKKNYGKFFLNSLPPSATCFAPRDKVLSEMNAFFTNRSC